MYTTLEYKAQKAIIDERVRNAALARHRAVRSDRTTMRRPTLSSLIYPRLRARPAA
jgi:hypothetical protein